MDSEMESDEDEDYSTSTESAAEDSLHDVEGMAFLTDVSFFDISVRSNSFPLIPGCARFEERSSGFRNGI